MTSGRCPHTRRCCSCAERRGAARGLVVPPRRPSLLFCRGRSVHPLETPGGGPGRALATLLGRRPSAAYSLIPLRGAARWEPCPATGAAALLRRDPSPVRQSTTAMATATAIAIGTAIATETDTVERREGRWAATRFAPQGSLGPGPRRGSSIAARCGPRFGAAGGPGGRSGGARPSASRQLSAPFSRGRQPSPITAPQPVGSPSKPSGLGAAQRPCWGC